MNKTTPIRSLPASIDATLDLLAKADYLADRSLATVLFLALKMGRPIFLEGEAGVGKTEIAKVLSATLGRRLIRLQCYEGLDVAAAVYEWNYAAQMIAIRLAEAEGAHDRDRIEHDIFSDRFLIKRPLLQALEPDPAGAPVLLIDELSMGLAPVIVDEILDVLRRLADERGMAVVLVEQHVQLALSIADRAGILVHGSIAIDDSAHALRADPARIERAYLSV